MTQWLVDKSALVRLGNSPDADAWAARVARGLVRITTVTRLEVGFSARSGQDARVPDLVVAAAAELAGLTLLHLDKDFDLIARITGQPVARLAVQRTAVPGWVLRWLPGAPDEHPSRVRAASGAVTGTARVAR